MFNDMMSAGVLFSAISKDFEGFFVYFQKDGDSKTAQPQRLRTGKGVKSTQSISFIIRLSKAYFPRATNFVISPLLKKASSSE